MVFFRKKVKKPQESDNAAGDAHHGYEVEGSSVPVDIGLRASVTDKTAGISPKMKELFPDEDSIYGLRALHTPSNYDIDIVFIHGLTGRTDKTFLHDATGIYWPVHLLPLVIPNARVLTFGYDADLAHFMGAVGKNTIEDHASNLVNDLARMRRGSLSASGSIIFVAHSLGGLITKKAMALSENAAAEHLRQIERDTVAIAFFGTPHRGSNLAPFAKFVASVFQASGKRVNSDILEVLKRDSQVLAGVESAFVNWVARKDKQFKISCFYETEELPGVGMIVKAESAKFGHWPQQSIRANHMDMVKFPSVEDEGFQRAIEELQRWIEELGQHQDCLNLQNRSEENIRSALEACIDLMGLRQNDMLTISTPPKVANQLFGTELEESIEWFTKSPEFQTWKEEEGLALLWIHALPGHGKTVLMSYVLKQLPHYIEYRRDWDVAAVFIRSADDSENSLLASIAFELIKHRPGAQSIWKEAKAQPTPSTEWELTNYLRILLKVAIAAATPRETIILIDGLDALTGDTRSSFLSHLLELGEQVKSMATIRILISSRAYPDIKDVLSHYPHIEPDKERKDCLETLYFEEWNARETAIREAEGGKWLRNHPEYAQWSNSVVSEFLWLEGKPGSGKSTLSKRIVRNIRERRVNSSQHSSGDEGANDHQGLGRTNSLDQDTVVAKFFYSFRGGITETSHALMLRSLVYQIWSQNTRLFPLLQKQYRQLKERNESVMAGKNPFWKYDELKAALLSLHQIDFPINIFIIVDGMDESDNKKRNDVLNFLPTLSAQSSQCIIKVLVASRPETTINMMLMQGRHIVLQEVNKEDIQLAVDRGIGYLESLRESSKDVTNGFSKIKIYILENSQGVFLWVSLVLQDLERTIKKGAYTMDHLMKQVRKLPKDLGGPNGFYRLMVESIIRHQESDESQWDEEKEEDLQKTRRILAWVTFPRNPISIGELEAVLATPAQSDDFDPLSYDFEQHKPQNLPQGILSYCGGLVEVQTSSHIVQLIHQTAREFLLDQLQPAKPYHLDQVSGDREIAATCCRYLRLAFMATIPQLEADKGHKQLDQLTECLEECKLLRYCFKYLAKHVDHLEHRGESICEEFEAFIKALSTQPNSFASLLLSPWAKESVLKSSQWMVPNELNSRNCLQSVLVSAVGSGKAQVVDMLILLQANVNNCNEKKQYPLESAVKLGNESMVSQLLAHGADVNQRLVRLDIMAPSQYYGSALQAASFQGHEGIVQILLNKGANVNLPGGHYGSALQAASFQGHEGIVQILLNKGANVNLPGGHYGSALQAASFQGHEGIVQILLNKGANFNIRKGHYGSALQAASAEGHEGIVQILLDKGANVDADREYSRMMGP